jgi:hypothetical protein
VSATYYQGSVGAYVVVFTIPSDTATGTDRPISLGAVVGGTTVFDNQFLTIQGIF